MEFGNHFMQKICLKLSEMLIFCPKFKIKQVKVTAVAHLGWGQGRRYVS